MRYSITQVINSGTRLSNTRASLLDHIYTSNVSNVHESGVITYGMTDHHITFINLKLIYQKIKKINLAVGGCVPMTETY